MSCKVCTFYGCIVTDKIVRIGIQVGLPEGEEKKDKRKEKV
jgi:hypothetical protein